MRRMLGLVVSGTICGTACGGGAKDSGAVGATETVEPVDLLTQLSEPGPYTAGYRVTEVTYDSSEGARSLRFAVWYPSDATEGDFPRYNNLIETDGAFADVDVSADGPFPVHVYSHGHQGYAEASGFWMEHLASHGFIVAAPDHTGNTTFDGSDRATEIYYLRSEDIGASIDAVSAASGPLAFLSGKVDPTGITASGHSFGGYTLHSLAGASYDPALIAQCLDGSDTTAYCSTMDESKAAVLEAGLSDPRIEAFVSMAPGDYRLFGADGFAAIDRPVLHMTGDLDPQTGGVAEDIWSGLAGSIHRRVDIAGGGHQTFTDFSGVLETFDGLIDAPAGFRIVNVYGLGWMRHQRGELDAAELFDGTLAVDPAVTLSE